MFSGRKKILPYSCVYVRTGALVLQFHRIETELLRGRSMPQSPLSDDIQRRSANYMTCLSNGRMHNVSLSRAVTSFHYLSYISKVRSILTFSNWRMIMSGPFIAAHMWLHWWSTGLRLYVALNSLVRLWNMNEPATLCYHVVPFMVLSCNKLLRLRMSNEPMASN